MDVRLVYIKKERQGDRQRDLERKKINEEDRLKSPEGKAD